MPRFEHISGDRFGAFRITNDESVFVAVGGEPSACGGIGKALVYAVAVYRKSGLMFGVSGAGGISVRSCGAVAGGVSLIESLLIFIASVAGDGLYVKPICRCRGLQFCKSLAALLC